MNFEIVKLTHLSGEGATIYSIIMEDDDVTLLDHFIEENENHFGAEVKNILKQIRSIGKLTGAHEELFKVFEGAVGDGVCALFDNPDSKLRLYCIRYGKCALILGGGGPKSKAIKAYQEDTKLTNENKIMKKVSRRIMDALKQKDLRWSVDGMELIGDLNFIDDEE